MEHLHRPTLVLLAVVLVLLPALPAVAAVDAEPPRPLDRLEVLLDWFADLWPVETAAVEAASEVSTDDPAGTITPTDSDPLLTSVPEDSSGTESGHLIDPNG